jgi:hypothetical protein
MTERLEGRLRIDKKGLLGRTKFVEVTPFETLDAAMTRDGIDKKAPAGIQLGDRAWWTATALAAVDPARWTQAFGLTAAQLIEAARQGEWKDLLTEGWQRAAIRYRAGAWLEAFALATEASAPSLAVEVFRAMSPDAAERAMRSLIEKEPKAWLPLAPECCRAAWSVAFTAAFIAATEKARPKDPTDLFHYHLKPMLRAAALVASPEFNAAPPDDVYSEFAEIVAFRRSMRLALDEKENR